MTLRSRFGKIDIGDLVWYWCFRDSKRKAGIVLNYEVSAQPHNTLVLVQVTGYSQWYKAHSLMLTKDQIQEEKGIDADNGLVPSLSRGKTIGGTHEYQF